VTVMHVVNALGRNPLLEVMRKDLIENKCSKNHCFLGFLSSCNTIRHFNTSHKDVPITAYLTFVKL
jgi:hypothetical protein